MPLLILLFHLSYSFYEMQRVNFLNMHNFERTGGVDLFFVLSGFLMFYLYSEKKGKEGISSDFLIKRLIRIVPIYWILNVAFFLMHSGFEESNLSFLVRSMLFLPGGKIIGPAWSLSHTMLFYVLFSLYLKKPKLFEPIFIIASFVTLTGFHYTILEIFKVEAMWVEFVFNPHNIQFMLGVYGASFVRRYNVRRGFVLILIGLLGYGFAWYSFSIELEIWLNYTVLFGISAMLILIGTASIDLKKEVHIPKIIKILANSSFAIYLSHEVLMGLVTDTLSKLGVFGFIKGYFAFFLTAGITALLGIAIYYGFEKHLNKLLKSIYIKVKSKNIKLFSNKAFIISLITCCVTLFIILSNVFQPGELYESSEAASMEEAEIFEEVIETDDISREFLVYTPGEIYEETPLLIVLGDSDPDREYIDIILDFIEEEYVIIVYMKGDYHDILEESEFIKWESPDETRIMRTVDEEELLYELIYFMGDEFEINLDEVYILGFESL